jgi:hypothetical protein
MNAKGRVFEVVAIEDHLSREQIIRFATLLDECIEHGYGEVIITVTNHHPNKVIVRFEEKLPLPKRGE